MRLVVISLAVCVSALGAAQSRYDRFVNPLKAKGLTELGAYKLLTELSGGIGPRLSGSLNAQKAVQWGMEAMEEMGLDKVHLVPCMVPHWVRGNIEDLTMSDDTKLTCCALGGSIATPDGGLEAEVIEVHSLDEAQKLGDKAKGKFIFYNRPFDSSLTNTFAQYGTAGDQRFVGPSVAAKLGAAGALVRSLTGDADDVPHTGVTEFPKDAPRVPCVALSIVAANKLSQALKSGSTKVKLTLNCEILPDAPSFDVVGQITGSEKPNEVIVMGGHLDSWDKGRGAHDDGAGVTQSMEALRLLKELGWRPKRTIRVVLFMNEENGGRGAEAYAAYAKTAPEKHIAAMESDSGGFAPRGFGVSLKSNAVRRINKWLPALSAFEIEHFSAGGEGGADVDPLAFTKAVIFGLEPESQRYFDYHHSDKDTIDKVNPRELELGALSMAMLAWLISEEGI